MERCGEMADIRYGFGAERQTRERILINLSWDFAEFAIDPRNSDTRLDEGAFHQR
jgi:hypothetical protein